MSLAASQVVVRHPHATRVEGREQVDFVSVDSTPRRFAGPVAHWRAPALLASFCLIAPALLWLVSNPFVVAIFPHNDLIFSPYAGTHAVAIRVFVLSFYLAFSLFALATPMSKLYFAADLVLTFALLCAVYDLANILLARQLGIIYPLYFIEIISGLIGFAVFSLKLLERGRMPVRIPIEYHPRKQGTAIIRLAVAVIVAASISIHVGSLRLPVVEQLRQLTLLGGIGPGVFLFLPCFFAQLYLIAIVDRLRLRAPAFRPPLSIIVPAHNEAYIIASTIKAMDRAAAHYGGEVVILILNNNSTDATGEIAEAALAACAHAKGRVIEVPRPGKSHALNAGLDAIETEFFVRVDADTQLGEDNLSRAMRYFGNPAIGIVGGVPIPPGGGIFDRARLLEVLVKHGYYSVAMGTVQGLVGVPGMFVVYRTAHPRQLGGFVEGMNGEDTDMSLRIGELGYYAVVDPKIRYISEVPATYRHMREQRLRWFRSVYHISARCRDLFYSDGPTLRGKIILPYMLLNSSRRAMLVPLVIFGCISYFGDFNPEAPLAWRSIVAVIVGAPALVAVAAALLNGMPRAVLALPEYLLFRMLRAYFTLESMLSISIRINREDLAFASLRNLLSNQPTRIA